MTGPIHGRPSGEADAETRALGVGRTLLEANREGTLCFDDHHVPVKFVSESASGRLVASVPVATFFADEHVLWVPEEHEDALQCLVSPEEIEESHATDRWMAFHGEPEHVRWAAFWIDSARHGPWVFDGDAMAEPNALAEIEPRLVRAMNADPAALATLCERASGSPTPDPLCVGVDPRGVYVRARFGVVRVAFEEACEDGAAAERLIASLLEGSGG